MDERKTYRALVTISRARIYEIGELLTLTEEEAAQLGNQIELVESVQEPAETPAETPEVVTDPAPEATPEVVVAPAETPAPEVTETPATETPAE